jgi:hypothetical protein
MRAVWPLEYTKVFCVIWGLEGPGAVGDDVGEETDRNKRTRGLCVLVGGACNGGRAALRRSGDPVE